MSLRQVGHGGKPREIHDREWRDPAQAAQAWPQEEGTDLELLRTRVRGAFWETLAESGITLLVTREYEHLLVGLSAAHGTPRATYWPMPHPSGLTVDRKRGVVHVASTRNPNQIYDFTPAGGLIRRLDSTGPSRKDRPLVPARSRFFPGCLYIHDLALIGGKLHANAVGENAVVRIQQDGSTRRVWWPRCIETPRGPVFGRNHLQLNSIAAGKDLKSSYFSASAEGISARRPGHRGFPVKGRGVIFSGATREPIARGLTRPHSARLAADGTLWAANSGYGHLVVVRDGGFDEVAALPGWTRGLTLHNRIAYVGTSRVIPRFRQYAPGLDLERSLCGVHAVDTRSGRLLGSLLWPDGDQIFAVDWAPRTLTGGFPFSAKGKRSRREDARLFYAFQRES